MKIFYKMSAFMVAAMLSIPAFSAEVKPGFYIAPEIGRATIEDYCDGLAGLGLSGSCAGSAVGFGVSGGYQFNKFIAAEVGGRYASGFDVNLTDRLGNTINIEADYLSFSLGGQGRLPIGESFALIGKAGIHSWKAELDASVGNSVSNDDTSGYYGAGVEFVMGETRSLRAEYTRYNSDVYFITGSLVLRF